jgi:hypothetical protein
MGWSIHHPVGLIHDDLRQAFQGYTLIANLEGHDASLIDMTGRVCHRWHSDEGLSYGVLLDDGRLLCRARPSGGATEAGIPGSALIELDWDGNVVWAYRDPMLHHDFVRLPSGNTLVVRFEEVPHELAVRIVGGRTKPGESESMLGDIVTEITPAGEVVREWRLWEALDPVSDVICPLDRRHQWTHQNALSLTAQGDLRVSLRKIDTVGIVDRGSGAFTWKWGPGQLSHQHDPTYLENGHVLVFDNGPHRGGPTYSSVVEVDPSTNEIAWKYVGSPPISFYSYHVGGAERQPNGNTLICEGAPGRVFEVTADGEIVWEYVNPNVASTEIQGSGNASAGAGNSMFRAHRYAPDHPGLKGRDLTPEA